MKCNLCEIAIKHGDKVVLDEEGKVQCLQCAKHSNNIMFNKENVFIFKED